MEEDASHWYGLSFDGLDCRHWLPFLSELHNVQPEPEFEQSQRRHELNRCAVLRREACGDKAPATGVGAVAATTSGAPLAMGAATSEQHLARNDRL